LKIERVKEEKKVLGRPSTSRGGRERPPNTREASIVYMFYRQVNTVSIFNVKGPINMVLFS
jgi:hypothetical protein